MYIFKSLNNVNQKLLKKCDIDYQVFNLVNLL